MATLRPGTGGPRYSSGSNTSPESSVTYSEKHLPRNPYYDNAYLLPRLELPVDGAGSDADLLQLLGVEAARAALLGDNKAVAGNPVPQGRRHHREPRLLQQRPAALVLVKRDPTVRFLLGKAQI